MVAADKNKKAGGQRTSTVSYACLALLADGPLTASQIVSGMDRLGIRLFWPRAASGVYEEPHRLCQLGLAEVTGPTARGRGTTYAITTAGRDALRAWLAEPGQPPSAQYEALLKIQCSDHGSVEQLVVQIDAVKDHVVRGLVRLIGHATAIGAEGFRNPPAARIRALIFDYSVQDVLMRARWVIEAERFVRESSDEPPDEAELATLTQWYLVRSAELAAALERFHRAQPSGDPTPLPHLARSTASG